MRLWLAWVFIFCIAIAFASRWVLSKWVMNDNFSPHTVFSLSSLSYFVGAAICFAIAFGGFAKVRESLVKDVPRMNWKHWLVLCAFPLLFACAGYLVVYILSTMNVSVLYPVYNALMLLLTIVCSFAFLREKLSITLGVGLAFILVGVGLTVAHSFIRKK